MSQAVSLILGLAAFLAIMGVGLLVYFVAQGTRQQRLGRRLSEPRPGDEQIRVEVGQGREWLSRMAEHGQYIDQQVLKKPEETTALLTQAGWWEPGQRAIFYTIQVLLPLGMLALSVPLWILLGGAVETSTATMLVLIVVILSILAPRYALRWTAKRRRDRLRGEVPLFINLLILLFEAGLSTRQALASLVQDGEGTLPVLTRELRPVLRQIEAGADAGNLLYEMGKLLQVSELETVLGILRQVDRYGGEIREPLSDALATFEERRSLELREDVNILSGKMTVVLVACFFPALLIIIIGPAVMSIFQGLSSL